LEVVQVEFISVESNTANRLLIVGGYKEYKKYYRIATEQTFETHIEAEIFASIRFIKKYKMLNSYDKNRLLKIFEIAESRTNSFSNTYPDLVVLNMMQ